MGGHHEDAISYLDVKHAIEQEQVTIHTYCLEFFGSHYENYEVVVHNGEGGIIIRSEVLNNVGGYTNKQIREEHNLTKLLLGGCFTFKSSSVMKKYDDRGNCITWDANNGVRWVRTYNNHNDILTHKQYFDDVLDHEYEYTYNSEYQPLSYVHSSGPSWSQTYADSGKPLVWTNNRTGETSLL
jgi:YD repeat-containing protein